MLCQRKTSVRLRNTEVRSAGGSPPSGSYVDRLDAWPAKNLLIDSLRSVEKFVAVTWPRSPAISSTLPWPSELFGEPRLDEEYKKQN